MPRILSIFVTLFIVFYGARCEKADKPPEIYSLHITSQIVSRFATTVVTSRLANRRNESVEAIFIAQLPNAAFISNFSMEINGKIIYGIVKEKEKAKKQYEKAKKKGQTAGHVAVQSPRETNTFRISVNVAALGKVTFNLTYQEILQRIHGVYKHILNIQPGQVVRDLKVDIFITESREITKIMVPKFGEKLGENTNQDLLKQPLDDDVEIDSILGGDLSRVHVSYHTSPEKQIEMHNRTEGLNGQMVVLYDVERNEGGGELQVVNGYFVHFFAPKNLKVANKQIVFIIDSSGSMEGRKMLQTKEAMTSILRQLNPGDRFNILDFDGTVKRWRSESVTATKRNVDEAITFVMNLTANGGTNINGALEDGLRMLSADEVPHYLVPMIIFLTDGQATEGVTSPTRILQNIQKSNPNSGVSIQSVAFGAGADLYLLRKISHQNHGLARKIYEDSDSALQLEGFYVEISSLLLRNVKIRYLDESVEPESIVQDNEYNYFEGSEMVVVGKLKDSERTVTAEITGNAALGVEATFKTESTVQNPQAMGNFVERMWAYLTIKKLLDKSKFDSNVTEKAKLRSEALELSLKYNFVTELTSMVTTQDEESTNNTKILSDTPLKRQKKKGQSHRQRSSVFQATGDPHYKTADGLSFHPQHEGRHILMRTKKNKTNTSVTPFEIIADNRCTKRYNGTCIISVFGYAELHVYGKVITVSSTGSVMLADKPLPLPYSYTDQDKFVRVWHLGGYTSYIRLRTDFGMEVTLAVNRSFFRVKFPHKLDYKDQIEGLLGGLDFDGNPYNDLRLPSGQVFYGSYIYDYVSEWMESEKDKQRLRATKDDTLPQLCQGPKAHKATQHCDKYLNKNTGIFKECFTDPYITKRMIRVQRKYPEGHPKREKVTHDLMKPGRQQRFQHEIHLYAQDYLEACRLDVCATNNKKVACQYVERFEADCMKLKGGDPKFTLPSWRSKKFCPKQCSDPHSEFVDCLKCQVTCSKKVKTTCNQDETKCNPGCQCKPGFLLDKHGKHCIKRSHCK